MRAPCGQISDPLFLFTKRKSFKNSPGKVNFLLIKLKQNKTKQNKVDKMNLNRRFSWLNWPSPYHLLICLFSFFCFSLSMTRTLDNWNFFRIPYKARVSGSFIHVVRSFANLSEQKRKRKRFNSHRRTGLRPQHGSCFKVLVHQYC